MLRLVFEEYSGRTLFEFFPAHLVFEHPNFLVLVDIT
jgi:hypothetical protein